MALPPPNIEWPPAELARPHAEMGRWSAWWGGDPDELTRTYGGYTGTNDTERSFTERGGVAGAVRRFFWGTPTPDGEERTKLHMPIASEICAMSADLVFGQPPTVTVEDGSKGEGNVKTQDRVNELLDDPTDTVLHDAAEECAALGHVYLRGSWDKEVDPKGPILSAVDADCAFPRYGYGRLLDCSFVRTWDMNGSVLRHFEFHEVGIVWHAVYLGDHRNLGRQVALRDHPETADLEVEGMIADDSRPGAGLQTGIDRLAVTAVPNARSKLWRGIPAARDLGRSDLAEIEGPMDALDDTWTSWMRDIDHGRSRIHVPEHMLEQRGRGQGATFNLQRSLYVPLKSPPDGGLQLTTTQFAIRFQEHRESALSLAERCYSGAGYSPETFGINATAALTATESWSRQMRSQHTRNAKIRRWKPGTGNSVAILLALDNAQFGGKNNLDAKINVEFADTVTESQLARANTAVALRSAEAASTRTIVELVHNDWDSERIDEEVRLIEGTAGDERNPNPNPNPGQVRPGDVRPVPGVGGPDPGAIGR